MKLKIVSLALSSLLLPLGSYAYTFKFSNTTERNIVINYKLEGLSEDYYDIIPADQSITRSFANAHCFGQSILWAEFKTEDSLGRAIPHNGGLDFIDEDSGIIPKGEKQKLFKNKIAHKYALIPMQIKVVDNETYQLTIDAAKGITQGIETLGCQIVSTVFGGINDTKKDTEEKTPNVKSDIIAVDDFEDLLDEDKPQTTPLGLPSTRQPLALPSTITGETSNSSVFALPTTTNSATAIYAELQQYLRDKNSRSAFLIMKNNKEKLLTLIPQDNFNYAYNLLTKESLKDYEFELVSFLIGSKSEPKRIGYDKDDINTNFNIKGAMSSLTSKNKCRLGLAKMAKNAGNLAGVSLCRDLHFAIVDTGEVGVPLQKGKTVTRVKKPILIAEINQGG
jgi:hypothetical protein